ncbi:MAG: hypothetical protein WCT33_00845 [Patescibacteria group bacterium]
MFRKILSRFRKALLPILGVLAVLIFVGLVFPVKTEAILGVDVSDAIIGAIGSFGANIMKLLGALLGMLIELVIKIFSYNNFVNMKAPPAVHIGWTIIRDLSNMMFIVILIVIAFGTIMKLQQYHARSLLTKMIIMAVLINFSKTITGIFVDFSQVIMLTFVNSFKDSAAIVLTVGLNLAQMTSFAKDTDGMLGIGSVIMAIFLANGMLVVAIAVLLAMLVILIARILMIWILVILSPVAYIASVLPNTSRYASRWWTELGKNLTAGPVLAFFLWLSLSVISTSAGAPIDLSDIGVSDGTLADSDAVDATKLPKGASAIMNTQNMFNYIITIALLLTGIMLTQEFGVMGGSTVGRFPDKLKSMGMKTLKKPFNNRFAKRTYGAIGRKITEKAPILSPSYWKGIGQRGERLATQQNREIAGKGEEMAEKVMDEWLPRFFRQKRGNLKVSPKGAAMQRAEMARSAVVGEYKGEMMKEISESGAGKEKMAELAEQAMRLGGIKGERSREAIIELAAERGNLDDVYAHFLSSGLIKDNTTAQQFGFDSWEKAKVMDDEGFKQFTMGYLQLDRGKFDPTTIAKRKAKEQNIDYDKADPKERSRLMKEATAESNKSAENATHEEQTALRTMYTISQSSRNVGHWEQTMATLDAKTGKYRIMNEDERIGEVKGEARKRGSRAFMQGVAPHAMHSLVYKENRKDEDGKDLGAGWDFSTDADLMSVSQKRFLGEVLTPSMIPEAHHFQARLSQILVGSHNGISDENWRDRIFDEKGNFVPEKDENNNVVLDEKGMPKPDPVAKKRFEDIYAINPSMIRALWNSAYRGAKKPELSIPIDEDYYNYSNDKEKMPVDVSRMKPGLGELPKEKPVLEPKAAAEKHEKDLRTSLKDRTPISDGDFTYEYDEVLDKKTGGKKKWAKKKMDGEFVDTLDDDAMEGVVNAQVAGVKKLSDDLEAANQAAIEQGLADLMPKDAESMTGMDALAAGLADLSNQFATLGKVIDPQSFLDLNQSIGNMVLALKENIDKIKDPEKQNKARDAVDAFGLHSELVASGKMNNPMMQQTLVYALTQLVKTLKGEKAGKGEEAPSGDGAPKPSSGGGQTGPRPAASRSSGPNPRPSRPQGGAGPAPSPAGTTDWHEVTPKPEASKPDTRNPNTATTEQAPATGDVPPASGPTPEPPAEPNPKPDSEE